MNYDSIDILYRSRKTLLDILAKDGYNITPYTKFSHKEILEMLKGGEKAFRMDLERSEEDAKGGPLKCRVVYALNKIKLRLAGWVSKLTDPESDEYVDAASTEVIAILAQDPVIQSFHTAALAQYSKHKLRLRFFQAAAIIINPLEHMLVPPHEKVASEQVEDLLKSIFCTSRNKLPIIRFHEDPIARLLGLVPGDIVKILRPSPTSLVYEPYYRVCAP